MHHIVCTFACLLAMVAGIQGCPRGWVYWSGSCYQLSEIFAEYKDALASCRGMKSSLVDINSALENCFLYDNLVKPTNLRHYIGIMRDANDYDRFITSDGNELEYTNWMRGEPNNYRGKDESCVEMRQGVWNDLPCSRKRHFICETKFSCKNAPCKNGGKCTDMNVPETMSYFSAQTYFKCECVAPFFGKLCEKELKPCPKGWTGHSSYCYQAQAGARPWAKARSVCLRKGADLADIQSENESVFLHNTFKKRDFWIGVIDCLGDKKCTSSYSALKFKRWDVDQPKDLGNNVLACATVSKDSGKWHDEDCKLAKRGVVCKQAGFVLT